MGVGEGDVLSDFRIKFEMTEAREFVRGWADGTQHPSHRLLSIIGITLFSTVINAVKPCILRYGHICSHSLDE